jgi:hypothetical protein
MRDFQLSESQIIEIIEVIFTACLCFAFLIILIFHYYRNKYLTLTKK